MSAEERLWTELQDGHASIVMVPPSEDLGEAANTMRGWGLSRGRELSIAPMFTEEDQKLVIGFGRPLVVNVS